MTNISLYKIFTFNILLIFFLIIFSKDSVAGAGSTEIEEIQVNKNPLEINEGNIAKGKKQWRKTGCYSCHGGNAEGGVGPSLQDDVWVYKPTDKMLFKTISKGRSGTVMVGWDSELSQTEIWEVIVFIRSLYNGDKSKIIW
ncbi:MAG: c-type cytochrome [Gammaproteobacteria bacterium]|nr:c-type cytochrome [Gammaproteobacteria bacterium]